MATATDLPRVDRPRVVLEGIPWDLYVAMRDLPGNRHKGMAYFNGLLELTTPEFLYEVMGNRLGDFVLVVAMVLGIDCTGARKTTLRRKGDEPQKGYGKEPDESFYIAHEPLVRKNRKIDLEVDPPPDLAIEVDNTRDSAGKLPIYAALGVPEVWRYDVNTEVIWFGHLQADGTYAPIERSACLPMLTPALVLDGLRIGAGMSESRWMGRLRDWVRDELARPDAPGLDPAGGAGG